MGKPEEIVAGLGGAANVTELRPCATRLRARVVNVGMVDVPVLHRAGAYEVMQAGHVVQVVVGAEAESIAAAIDTLLSA